MNLKIVTAGHEVAFYVGGLERSDVCPGPESNQRHADFQSAALPTELPGRNFLTPDCYHVGLIITISVTIVTPGEPE